MRFSMLLNEAGIAAQDVTLVLHNTTLEPLRAQLPWMARHRPELFAAYQAVHNDQASATLAKRPLVASFAPSSGGQRLFLGLFSVAACDLHPRAEIYADPRYRELEQDFGATDTAPDRNIAKEGEQRLFDLQPDHRLSDYAGRIEVATPEGRTYARHADTTDLEITALHAHPANDPPMPDWRNLVLTTARLRHLPQPWSDRLRNWRGIYLIIDKTDGQRYIGAAYGQDNLLGRWQAHIAADRGIATRLRQRNPQNFCFSILELTSPTAPPDYVIALESGWKSRLHTRECGLNEN